MSVKQLRKEVEMLSRVTQPKVNMEVEELTELIRSYMNTVENATLREVEEAERYAEHLKADPLKVDPYAVSIANANACNLRSAYVRRHKT